MNMKKDIETGTAAGRLRDVSFKIRGLAHLLKNQREHSTFTGNMEETYYGIGAIFDGLGHRVRSIAEEIDRAAINKRDGDK
ncbi:MAG: hypothetical protein A2583_15950 [Bdellovibrionales bacterium RIFOXYD1_FULL_53_11]|nr:MAG: hypothetical protein A2583_15950 [Bdellovibrionales bacterium RIFOXYD1_FULL_53_11]